MIHKIENKKLEIEILGHVYNISKPKYKDMVEMQEKMESLNEKEKALFVSEKLVSYGIPQEVLNELDTDAYIELITLVNGSKKNSATSS